MSFSGDVVDVRNLVYVGDYARALSIAATLPTSPERDRLVRRAHVCMGHYDAVLASSPDDKLSLYRSLPENDPRRSEIVQQVSTADSSTDPIEAAMILLSEQDYGGALSVLHARSSDISEPLEASALRVDSFLHMNRPDLALRAAEEMQKTEDDAVLTHLSLGRVFLQTNRVNDSFFLFEELSQRYGRTVLLLNCMAVCHMKSCHWDDAEKCLVDAMSQRANDAETLVNMSICTLHSAKPRELVERYLAQLRAVAPSHPWAKDVRAVERVFDERCPSQ